MNELIADLKSKLETTFGLNKENEPDNPFKSMEFKEKISTISRGIGLLAKHGITNTSNVYEHSGYPDTLRSTLNVDHPELGFKRTDGNNLDKAIEFGGAYHWASLPDVTESDAKDMAKAYQLLDYMKASTPERVQDSIRGYQNNLAGIEQAFKDKKDKKDFVNIGDKSFEYSQTKNENDFGNRPDGTKKGMGYLGVLKRPDGNVSTEISMSFDDVNNGKDIPLLVPTLTKKEIDAILTIDPKDPDFNRKVPKSAINKAIDHARKRIKEKKPVFAD